MDVKVTITPSLRYPKLEHVKAHLKDKHFRLKDMVEHDHEHSHEDNNSHNSCLEDPGNSKELLLE